MNRHVCLHIQLTIGLIMSIQTKLIYITTDTPDNAHLIGKALVEEGLAACANILAPMTAIFRWDGRVKEERETALLVKTTEQQVDALTKRVVALHTFSCPCVVSIPIDGGNSAFLRWIVNETGLC